MTEEEAKKLRAGDAVLIIGTVVQNDGTDKLPVEVEVEGLDNFWPYPRTIHSATPRPLEVGDRVRFASNPNSTCGRIHCIVLPDAWVFWDGSSGPYHTTEGVGALVRVDD